LRNLDKKEYRIVLLIVAFAAIIGFISSSHRSKLEVVYPEQNAILTDQDFRIETNNGILQIGNSCFDEVKSIFPEGQILGMSTIYKPKTLDCLLTFTEDENILHKMHINTPVLNTSRGVKVGDPFAKAVEKYGKDYAYVKLSGKAGDFDAVYGNNDNIIFQVRKNSIVKIVLEKEYIDN